MLILTLFYLFVTFLLISFFLFIVTSVIITNAVLKHLIGRGLSFAANASLTKTMAILTGPIGWAITGLWTAADIAGPAYRVTIPAVFEITRLRQEYLYGDKIKDINFS